jgi:FAD dependent monooxygenase
MRGEMFLRLVFEGVVWVGRRVPSVLLQLVLTRNRFGYGFVMVERQTLRQCLYQNSPDKTKIHVSKGVVEIQQTDTGVSVTTQDGTIYNGSLVAGADGVHSRVRSEMWRLAEAEAQYPGSSPPITASEKDTLRAEYSCVFGISTTIPGLRSREHDLVYGDGYAILSFHNRQSVYWFVIHRMDRVYAYQDVPRFTAEDAKDMCMRKYGNVRIAEGVHVRHLWEYKKVASMIAMEQGICETWGSGRIVLVGDAVRKVNFTSWHIKFKVLRLTVSPDDSHAGSRGKRHNRRQRRASHLA